MADLNSTIVRGNLRVTDDASINGSISEGGVSLVDKYVAKSTKITYSSFATNGLQKFISQTDYTKPFYAHLKIFTSGVSETAINQTLEIKVINRNGGILLDGIAATRTTWSGNSGIYQLRGYIPKDTTSTYASYTGGVELNINSTTARNIEIEVIELNNCTVLSSPTTSTFNSTYHNSTTPSCCINGLWGMSLNDNASSSSNTYGTKVNGPALKTSTSVGIGRYTLFGYDAQRGDGASITSTFNSTGTSHVVNTTTVFHVGTHFMYNNSGSDYAASTGSSTVKIGTNNANSMYNSCDLRYSCNCSTTGFTKDTPLYLRVTPNFAAGTFTIHSDSLTQTLTSGGYYIYLGIIRSDTAYVLSLIEDQKMYYYNGTTLLDPMYATVIAALNTPV